MPQDRPPIPAELRRAVLIEAGHRCAIPTCRQYPVEVDHIVDWAKVRCHEFDNLIALCPTCHARKTGGDIDAKSMKQYKINLGVLTGRYSDLELRLLRWLVDYVPGRNRPMLPDGMIWTVGDLLLDGMIQLGDDGRLLPSGYPDGTQQKGIRTFNAERAAERNAKFVSLTEKGRELVDRWFGAKPIDMIPK
ncbi:HNH endonuclease signature motif containing protein [Crossiella sp. CA-258035]|uniref:HNH endonuclease n=1 Tax=Crossiella sp. CA-258035 TaxID=2981138 RepID=UPI0024BD0B39|nr:HNH endonuclease signature motif containing protein [Crossiella sp. CA-258035]WHT20199.1 HNH endonuclease signature motif containing protein [Crossiella sp. CA-258035]